MNPIQQSVFDEIITTLNLQINSENQLKVIGEFLMLQGMNTELTW